VAVDDVLPTGNKVVVRWHSVKQTHTGAYRGVPPTGRPVHMTAIQIFRLADGRIAECWLELDALGGARDMGVVPPEEISAARRGLFAVRCLFGFAVLEAKHALRSHRAPAAHG
jgi:SnoaL-like polyketide cyclase